MERAFPLDYVRQIIEQTLEFEHIANPKKYFGGKDQVNLFSFYEQLAKEDEINRYTDLYRDLVDQQNKTSIIANGTIVCPENPTFTNINQCTIVPMTFTGTFRVKLGDRDEMIDTINNLIYKLKGRKVDIAQLDNGKLFMVGTIANNSVGSPLVRVGDYIGTINSTENVDTQVSNIMNGLRTNYGINIDTPTNQTLYYYVHDSYDNKLKVVYYEDLGQGATSYELIVNEDSFSDVIFPPTHSSYEKWKVSISFESIRIDTPTILNASEYCVISFGGSATLVNSSVKLGNDLTKLMVQKNKILAKTPIEFTNATKYWLEPLEMPSGNNANTQINQLISNKFISNTHTDSIIGTLQYSFICDENIPLLEQWYNYGRYGISGITESDITPNLIYTIQEYYCSWGVVKVKEVLGKIVESIDIENTEGDVLTLSLTMQIQGENN